MSGPAPMDPDSLRAPPRPQLHVHDHAVCAYDTREDMLVSLGTFLAEGQDRRELSVFVHSFQTDDEAWQFVHRALPAATDMRRAEVVVVSLYEAAFEGGARRIDHEHVARVVTGIVDRAGSAGLRGARIFVDASRAYFAGDRAEEWFAFESWLGRRLDAKVGLVCAYQRQDIMRPEILPQVLRTHAYRFGVDAAR